MRRRAMVISTQAASHSLMRPWPARRVAHFAMQLLEQRAAGRCASASRSITAGSAISPSNRPMARSAALGPGPPGRQREDIAFGVGLEVEGVHHARRHDDDAGRLRLRAAIVQDRLRRLAEQEHRLEQARDGYGGRSPSHAARCARSGVLCAETLRPRTRLFRRKAGTREWSPCGRCVRQSVPWVHVPRSDLRRKSTIFLPPRPFRKTTPAR